MNAQTIMHLYRTTFDAYRNIVERIRTSDARRWLQRKCKKSQLLRFLLVAASCAVVGSAVKVVTFYLDWRRRKLITVGPTPSTGPISSLASLFGGAVGQHDGVSPA